jgi:tetratricopeptide (TPR) repeat protein
MTDQGQSGGSGSGRESWQGRKSRDDTPSFIRNVQARAEMLHPNRNTEEHIPVLTMPKSVRIWRRVRWPLFIGIVGTALGALALFTNDRLQARSVEKRIAEAHAGEQLATVQGLLEAGQILSLLVERHPERANAQAAWAWHAVLLGELFGPTEQYLARARAALDQAGSDTSGVAQAARAGVKALSGDPTGALEIVLEGLQLDPTEPRLLMARCMALAAAGRQSDAAAALDVLHGAHPNYLPARHLSLALALENGNREATRDLAGDLLARSQGNLFASLALVAAGLPDWGEDDPPAEAIAELQNDMNTLADRIVGAPPKLAALGRFLKGRVALLSGRTEDAVTDLGQAFGDDPSPAMLAWYGLAVRGFKGIEAALALFGEHPETTGPEVHDSTVRCLLDGHRVGPAREALAALQRTGALAEIAAELGWILAVRSGDLDTARQSLPPRLGARHWKSALELYEQLRSRGETEAIDALAASMSDALGPCAEAIRAWHGARVEKALAALDLDEAAPPCLQALGARFLLGHAEPARVERAARRAARAGDDDPLLVVLRARAVWLAEGRSAAAAVLDTVRERRADATPLKLALAEAYIDMGLATEGLSALEESVDDPAGLALRLRALAALGKKGEFQTALDQAINARGDAAAHPAPLVFELERDFEQGAFDRVLAKADRVLPEAGRWTAEIAEIKARALNIVGARGEADRALEAAARDGRKAAGQGEGWEVRLAQIRLNLRRGGAFLFKAQSVITDLHKTGLKDAELSYSYAVANIRQGNDRGAVRYLREAIEVDPSFVAAYSQLEALGKLTEEERAGLERTRPGASL